MSQDYAERREFYRITYEKPVKFMEVAGHGAPSASKAVSRDISQSGILFISKSFPRISSIIWINLPMKELSICKEIEARAFTVKNGILGRVVRVEEAPEGKSYSVGVCFVKKDDSAAKAFAEGLEGSLKSGR